ncbi:MAG: hypothetical protein R3C68_18820 [Myxococcota bacterium]
MSDLTIRQHLVQSIDAAVERLFVAGFLSGDRQRVDVAAPKQDSHGDFACAIALALACGARKNPREIAARLQTELGDAGGILEKTDIAGPGYLNLFIKNEAWGIRWGPFSPLVSSIFCSQAGRGQRVLVEFVSANPTGPLHVAHGRGRSPAMCWRAYLPRRATTLSASIMSTT